MKRVLILGAAGQVGRALHKELQSSEKFSEIEAWDRSRLDLDDLQKTRQQILDYKPSLIINSAAFHRVDDCEEQAAQAFQTNVVAVHNLASVARELDALFVHFSTDYVYGGDTERIMPYAESDLASPISVYGASRLAGEHMVKAMWSKHFLIRTSAVFGHSKSPTGNFAATMLSLAAEAKSLRVVDDQIVGPTFASDLAQKVIELITTDTYGLYHISNQGKASWYEYAQAVFEMSGIKADLSPTTTEQYKAKAARPHYSVLDNQGLRKLGFSPMRHWRDALKTYLNEHQY
ncbi:dTDP-4-dehydrorhamnose reductase [Myxococcota bacterium]|nr:dTDP-4-dehydrorhamnose reductase [Myxococcota bacterium]